MTDAPPPPEDKAQPWEEGRRLPKSLEELEGQKFAFDENVTAVFRKHEDGVVHPHTTIEAELPPSVAEALAKRDLQLKLDTPGLLRVLMDQSSGMSSGDGCISTPGGPSC